MKEIYQSSVKEVLGQMGSREEGLTIKEVEKSREKCGWNELAEGKKKSVLEIFLEQYKDFLVIILIASAIISGILGDAESAAVIVIVITMNAILGTVQTVKAEQSLQSLKKLSGPEAKVLRNGTVTPIPARELVVGDVILLEAGDYVPADGRLIENASLKIDESALTGESLAVEKSLDEIEEEVPLGDRNNMLFSGSFVTYGRGRAVVTSVDSACVSPITELPSATPIERTPAHRPSRMSETVSPTFTTLRTSRTPSASRLRNTMYGYVRVERAKLELGQRHEHVLLSLRAVHVVGRHGHDIGLEVLPLRHELAA